MCPEYRTQGPYRCQGQHGQLESEQGARQGKEHQVSQAHVRFLTVGFFRFRARTTGPWVHLYGLRGKNKNRISMRECSIFPMTPGFSSVSVQRLRNGFIDAIKLTKVFK
jgi:hypothetical protein